MKYAFHASYKDYLWLLAHDGCLWVENSFLPAADLTPPFHAVADICSGNDR